MDRLVSTNLALEEELGQARLVIAQLESQRDFLLEKVVALESEMRQDTLLAQRVTTKGKKRGRPAGEESGDRTGICIATLKSGKLCRRKQSGHYQYCGYHLPLDPTSGLQYCIYQGARGKKCGNPVPISGDGLCKYHRRERDGGGNDSDSDE